MNGSWTFYSSLEQLGIARGHESVQNILDTMPDSSVLIYAIDATNFNVPEYPYGYGVVKVTRQSMYRCSIEFVATGPNRRWFGTVAAQEGGAKFSGWLPAVAAELPQEYDLPLKTGVEIYANIAKSCYSRSQEGLIIIHFCCRKTDLTAFPTNVGSVLATLPVGFRPKSNVHCATVCSSTTSYAQYDKFNMVYVNTGGSLILHNPVSSLYFVLGTITYYAD